MNTFLTETLLNLSRWAKSWGNFDFQSSLNADWLAGLFLGVAVLVIAFGAGKTRMLLAILSTYIAAFLSSVFIYRLEIQKVIEQSLGVRGDFWASLAVFALIFAIAFFILNRSTLRSRMSLKESSPLIILFLSILETGFLVSLLVGFARGGQVLGWQISPLLLTYFGTKTAQFFWALLPLLAFWWAKPSKRSPIV